MDNEHKPEKRMDNKGEHPEECEKHHDHNSACISFVHQDVCVEAIVTIKPRIKVGEGASVHCGHCEIKKHPHPHHPPHHAPHHKAPTPEMVAHWHWDTQPRTSHEEDECSFVVSQELCLMIPLVFSAEAIVKSEKIHCENPDTDSGLCDHESSSAE